MKLSQLRFLVLGCAILAAGGRAEETGAGEAAAAAAPASTELVSVTIERTIDLAADPTASSSTRRGTQLVLRIRLSAAAAGVVRDRATISVAGHFDDPAGTPIAMNEAARERILLESRKDDSSVLHLTCELPPEGATAIDGFQLFAGKEAGSGGDGAGTDDPAARRYFVVEDIRPRKGENLGPPGTKLEWYRVESFGPKSISMRQLTDDAPAIDEIRLTNVEGSLLEPIKHASSAIRDPVEGGWVAILVFRDHVPLVVNLLIPATTPPREELLSVERVQLP